MRSLHRATLSLALTVAPMMGTGCVSLSPRNPVADSQRRVEQRMTAARYEENQGNLAQAKRMYGEIHQEHPQNAECSHRLAVVCTRLNQLHDAEVYFLQAYGTNPKDPELLSDMGYVAFLQKNYERSERLLEQSAELNRADRRTINNLAIVRGWRVEDEACLSTFRSIYGEDESIRRLAAIQMARGDKDRAQKNYDLAARISGRAPTTTIAQSAPVRTEIAAVPQPTAEFTLPAPAPVRSTPKQTVTQATAIAKPKWTRPNTIIQASDTIELPPPPAAPAEPVVEKSTSIISTAFIVTMAKSVDMTPTVAASGAHSSSSKRKSLPLDAPLSAVMELVPPSVEEIPPAPSSPAEPAIAVRAVKESMTAVAEIAVGLELAPPAVEAAVIENAAPASVATQPPAVERPSALPMDEAAPIRISAWHRTPVSRGGKPAEASAPSGNTQPQPVIDESSDAPESGLRGVCLVTLCEEKKIVPAGTEFIAEYQSQHYQFRSAQAMERFKAAPHRYAPAAGGLDVVSVRNERRVVPGSLAFSLWYRHQLYLFSCRENAEAFRRDPDTFVAAY